MKKQFIVWLKQNTKLSDASIEKYSSGVTAVSKDMIEQGVIYKHLMDSNIIELDIFLEKILNNLFFIAKNKKGNNMYSNSLKQFRYFLKDTNEIFESDILIENEQGITEKLSTVKSRIGQGEYRKKLLEKYDNMCIVTNINMPKLLIASHIKPWCICNNNERIDCENGLLLCVHIDKLFDSGLITFNNNGKLRVSSLIGEENKKRLQISTDIYVDLKGTSRLYDYMDYHRDVLFVK